MGEDKYRENVNQVEEMVAETDESRVDQGAQSGKDPGVAREEGKAGNGVEASDEKGVMEECMNTERGHRLRWMFGRGWSRETWRGRGNKVSYRIIGMKVKREDPPCVTNQGKGDKVKYDLVTMSVRGQIMSEDVDQRDEQAGPRYV